MKVFSAVVKTLAISICQNKYQKDLKKAQTNAFRYACNKANGKYDINWHKNYNAKLKQGKQKAINQKELFTTFISNV